MEGLGDAADLLDDAISPSVEHPCNSLADVSAEPDRVSSTLSPLIDVELSLATQLIRGHSVVEVPGK